MSSQLSSMISEFLWIPKIHPYHFNSSTVILLCYRGRNSKSKTKNNVELTCRPSFPYFFTRIELLKFIRIYLVELRFKRESKIIHSQASFTASVDTDVAADTAIRLRYTFSLFLSYN